jgi:hypothetical protein
VQRTLDVPGRAVDRQVVAESGVSLSKHVGKWYPSGNPSSVGTSIRQTGTVNGATRESRAFVSDATSPILTAIVRQSLQCAQSRASDCAVTRARMEPGFAHDGCVTEQAVGSFKRPQN